MLTDGEVSQPDQVYDLVSNYCNRNDKDCKLFSFGIGDQFDKNLVE